MLLSILYLKIRAAMLMIRASNAIELTFSLMMSEDFILDNFWAFRLEDTSHFYFIKFLSDILMCRF